jgi:hypothetical protein
MKPVSPTAVKRKGFGAILAVIGFLLSPLSWWNDLFINVPLALGFAWLASWFYHEAFTASFILGYWLTNVAGLVLMQRGAETLLSSELRPYRGRQIARDLVIALLYTALMLLLVKSGLVGPLPGPGAL